MMSDIFSLLTEAKKLQEGDRGQILIQKKKPSKKFPIEGDNRGQTMGEDPDPTNSVKEARTEKAQGSKEGREAIQAHGKKSHANPVKSKVRIYSSITDALRRGYMGQIFSTKGADRLYVITKY